jgi:thiamine biosynthesis lipoprotein
VTSVSSFGPLSDQLSVRDIEATFTSMASHVNLRMSPETATPTQLTADVEQVFGAIAESCTRFDSTSALMRANANPLQWQHVGEPCFTAIVAAYDAYQDTGGRFDPRILRALRALGYDRSFAFDAAPAKTPAATADPRPTSALLWEPRFDPELLMVQLGPDPIDLGGIGKGLALRNAADLLRAASPYFLLEAGGDCVVGGAGPLGDGWAIGVEDPSGGAVPVAVLTMTDQACATTSTRIRNWRAGGKQVHHIIDPRTGEPSDRGLVAVTVVGPDPATAEVWSKSLFLSGRDEIADAADAAGQHTLWITEDGMLEMTESMTAHVTWRAR